MSKRGQAPPGSLLRPGNGPAGCRRPHLGYAGGRADRPQTADRLDYSAVVPHGPGAQMRHFFNLVKMNQMQFLKLKVGTDDDLAT